MTSTSATVSPEYGLTTLRYDENRRANLNIFIIEELLKSQILFFSKFKFKMTDMLSDLRIDEKISHIRDTLHKLGSTIGKDDDDY